MHVGFLHAAMGLGGAERVVADAAVERFLARGHRVTLFTAAHDAARTFAPPALEVRVHGAFLPARIAGRLQALCTVARLSWLAARMARERLDAVVCDGVPHAIPLLRAGLAPVLYYCHFPDQLLAPSRRGLMQLYRAPLDRLEIPTMRAAHSVVANSRFTAGVLARMGCDADVVYPGVDVDAYPDPEPPPGDEAVLLVVGRFDRRKNLPLAVAALAELRARSPRAFARASLHLAGALEDLEVVRDLGRRARALGLGSKVVVHPWPSEAQRLALLRRASCVLHTAVDEHFGLVPVEAMAAGRPVVAAASGALLETVVDGETGFLCPPDPAAFAAAIARVLDDPGAAARLGHAGRARARERYSRRAFGDALEGRLLELARAPS